MSNPTSKGTEVLAEERLLCVESVFLIRETERQSKRLGLSVRRSSSFEIRPLLGQLFRVENLEVLSGDGRSRDRVVDPSVEVLRVGSEVAKRSRL